MAAMTDTLAAPAGFTIEVKHSRFLAQAAAVDSPASALAFMAGVSDPAATHNCWAWRLADQYRSSDDGRSAERRVGKEGGSTCRSRWSPCQLQKKQTDTYRREKK